MESKSSRQKIGLNKTVSSGRNMATADGENALSNMINDSRRTKSQRRIRLTLQIKISPTVIHATSPTKTSAMRFFIKVCKWTDGHFTNPQFLFRQFCSMLHCTSTTKIWIYWILRQQPGLQVKSRWAYRFWFYSFIGSCSFTARGDS